MYSIFRVFDYKGGELNASINLTKNEFIQELIESRFEDVEGETISEIKENISEIINDDEFYEIYAGGDGFCGELYEHIDNKLVPIGFEDFIDDIAQELYRSNKEYEAGL